MLRQAPDASRPRHIEVAFHRVGDRDTARYVSSTTVREEALHHGRLTGLYWSATGQVARENMLGSLPGFDPLSRPSAVFELEIDGQSLNDRWDWTSATERLGVRAGTVEAVVELQHQLRPVTVRVVTRLDGTTVLARWLEITNTSGTPAALSRVSPWSGVLWTANWVDARLGWDAATHPRYSLGYQVAEKWGEEWDFTWRALPLETFRIERTMEHAFGSPYFVLHNEVTGELCFLGLAWSGPYVAEFSHRFDTCLSFHIGPLGAAPLRVIAPGETVKSPEVHLGMYHGGLDQAVQAWHRHMRASVIPARPAGKEMYTIAGRVVEQPGEWILREMDIAAEMGIEAFMVDAGWYGEEFRPWPENRGDWFEGSWMPGGIAGARDYAHARGMLFGLWMEAEAAGKQSRLTKEHPDWQLTRSDGLRFPSLNLAHPEAASYFEDAVLRVIHDHQLDFYKLDYNEFLDEGGQHIRHGYAEQEMWRHNETLYRVFDRVRQEFPLVALENCAGGGGRNDLGMLSRFHYACESDVSAFPFSIRAINAMTLYVPPESICYYHDHLMDAHLTADLDTHLRVALFANPVFVGFGAQSTDRNTPYFATTRRYIELAKAVCRPILVGHPAVYHHTPDIGLLRPADWCVLEYGSPDRMRGYAGVFKLSGGNAARGQDEFVFRPRGLDHARDFEVTLDNRHATFRMRGRELCNSGLVIRLDAAMTSELLLFKACEEQTENPLGNTMVETVTM